MKREHDTEGRDSGQLQLSRDSGQPRESNKKATPREQESSFEQENKRSIEQYMRTHKHTTYTAV
jgi:hypothetical protein